MAISQSSCLLHKPFLIVQVLMFFPCLIFAQLVLNFSSDSSSPFPPRFLFGTATSAYQHEGGFLSDGKGLNNWDVFSHQGGGGIVDGSNGDVSVDQYHRYEEHIDLMANLGVNSYQFSISWARILPKGRYGSLNLAGINYYSNLIDALLLRAIQPFVVLTHFDIPIELEDRYGGWLSTESVKDFQYLADICFKNFGDRVKYWVTFGEPNMWVNGAYRVGFFPPNRCSEPFGKCAEGDSEKEPFIAAHNIILAHAAAVKIYKTNYQKEQKGSIGIEVQTQWYEPLSNSTLDKQAAERAQSFCSNWFLDPIIFGRYPQEMTNILGSALPTFSGNDLEDLKFGADFIAINHYFSLYVQDCLFTSCEPSAGTSRTEGYIKLANFKDGIPIGELTGLPPLRTYPEGMEKTVTYIKERYNNIPIFISENGYCEISDSNSTINDSLNDVKRVSYLANYLDALSTAMRKGADVRGYFVWTLLDAFEWNNGYSKRYGLYHVDHNTLEIRPKLSASWYKEYIAKQKITKDIVTATSSSQLLQDI